MRKLAGFALILLILAASAALFRYALSGGEAPPPASPEAPSEPPAAVASPPGPPGPALSAETPPGEPAPVDVASPADPVTPPADPAASAPLSAPAARPAVPAAKEKPLSGEGVITGNAVNVRSENEYRPDTSNVVAKLNKGERVTLLAVERERNGPMRWYRVRTREGKEGWVREDLIKVDDR